MWRHVGDSSPAAQLPCTPSKSTTGGWSEIFSDPPTSLPPFLPLKGLFQSMSLMASLLSLWDPTLTASRSFRTGCSHDRAQDRGQFRGVAVVVQSLSHDWLFATPWTTARQASSSFIISRHLPKFKPIESVVPSNHLILCHSLLLLPSIFPSIRVFSSESAVCIKWPKNHSFSFSINSSNEHSGLISFRIDSFDLHAVQGTLKSLLQKHNSKASTL